MRDAERSASPFPIPTGRGLQRRAPGLRADRTSERCEARQSRRSSGRAARASGQHDQGGTVVRRGVPGDLREGDRHLLVAQSVELGRKTIRTSEIGPAAVVDPDAAGLALQHALFRRPAPCPDRDDRGGARLVPSREIGVGEGQPQAGRAPAGDLQRLIDIGLGIDRSAEFQKDQRAMLRRQPGKEIAGRNPVKRRKRLRRIARVGRRPGLTNGVTKPRSPASDRSRSSAKARPLSLARSASPTWSNLAFDRRVFRSQALHQPKRELHVAGADRLRNRFLRYRWASRPSYRRAPRTMRRPGVIAIDRGRACLQIGPGRVRRPGRERRRRQKQSRDSGGRKTAYMFG